MHSLSSVLQNICPIIQFILLVTSEIFVPYLIITSRMNIMEKCAVEFLNKWKMILKEIFCLTYLHLFWHLMSERQDYLTFVNLTFKKGKEETHYLQESMLYDVSLCLES